MYSFKLYNLICVLYYCFNCMSSYAVCLDGSETIISVVLAQKTRVKMATRASEINRCCVAAGTVRQLPQLPFTSATLAAAILTLW